MGSAREGFPILPVFSKILDGSGWGGKFDAVLKPDYCRPDYNTTGGINRNPHKKPPWR
jgi:hypothetical protein